MYLVASFPSPSPVVPHGCSLSSLEKQVRFLIPWLAFRRPHCQIAVDPTAMILCTRSRLLQALATSLMRDHVAGVNDPYLHAQVTTITQLYECMPHLRSTSDQTCSLCGLSFQSVRAFLSAWQEKPGMLRSFVFFVRATHSPGQISSRSTNPTYPSVRSLHPEDCRLPSQSAWLMRAAAPSITASPSPIAAVGASDYTLG